MRRIHVTSTLLGLGILILGLRVASAQINLDYKAEFDPEQFAASVDPDQIGLADGARTQTKGTLAVGLTFHYAGPALSLCLRDLSSDNPACQIEGDILNARLRADLGVLYGFGRFDLRLALPLVLHQSTDFATSAGGSPLNSMGVGNPKLGGRVQVARPGPFAIALDLGVTVPTGVHDFVGDRGLIAEPRLLVDLRRGPIELGLDLGYRYRQKPAQIADLYVDDELTWSAAAQYWVVPHRLALGATAYGRLGLINAPTDPMAAHPAVNEIGTQERPVEALASVRYFVVPRLAVEVGGGAGLDGGYGAAPFRVVAGLRWIDRKLEVPPPPVTDHDHDGLDDGDDKCPRAAEDPDGFEDDDGCPELDNDGDGVDDADDRCPLAAEDVDGVEDTDGCPDADVAGDADGDGLEDAADKCPNEAEVFNNVDDDDGCPDAGPTLAYIESNAVVITDKIFFDLNRARVKTRSEPVLNAVASILKAHSDLRVRIEGHTDDQGEPDWNRTLSQLRSERVRDYLIKRGIAAARLEAVGYGSDRPLVPGRGEAARDQNRRVEFVIIGHVGDPPSADAAPPEPEPEPEPEPTPDP